MRLPRSRIQNMDSETKLKHFWGGLISKVSVVMCIPVIYNFQVLLSLCLLIDMQYECVTVSDCSPLLINRKFRSR